MLLPFMLFEKWELMLLKGKRFKMQKWPPFMSTLPENGVSSCCLLKSMHTQMPKKPWLVLSYLGSRISNLMVRKLLVSASLHITIPRCSILTPKYMKMTKRFVQNAGTHTIIKTLFALCYNSLTSYKTKCKGFGEFSVCLWFFLMGEAESTCN